MRSTPIFKILSLAVLVAVVTLLGIEGYRYFHRSVSVSVAYTGQVTDSLSVRRRPCPTPPAPSCARFRKGRRSTPARP